MIFALFILINFFVLFKFLFVLMLFMSMMFLFCMMYNLSGILLNIFLMMMCLIVFLRMMFANWLNDCSVLMMFELLCSVMSRCLFRFFIRFVIVLRCYVFVIVWFVCVVVRDVRWSVRCVVCVGVWCDSVVCVLWMMCDGVRMRLRWG